jgi:hypothetical protein
MNNTECVFEDENFLLLIQAVILFFQLLIFAGQFNSMRRQTKLLSEQAKIQFDQKKIIEEQLKLNAINPKVAFVLESLPNLSETPTPTWEVQPGPKVLKFYESSLNKYEIDFFKARVLFPKEIWREVEILVSIQKEWIEMCIQFYKGGSSIHLLDSEDFISRRDFQKKKLMELLENHIKLYS